MQESYTFHIQEDSIRLDRYLTTQIPQKSRTIIQGWIEKGYVFYNKIVQKNSNFKVRTGGIIDVTVPLPVLSHLKAEAIPLNIIFENENLLVIDKPAGLVVHPAPGHQEGTLVNALLNYCPLSEIGGVQRPGIVHRLDKDTSGLMVVAKNDKTHHMLSAQFHDNKTLKRIYHAWIWTKIPPGQGIIDAPIGRHPKDRQKMAIVNHGKKAVTHYSCEEMFHNKIARLRFQLDTGRTHQIRVHCLLKGWPIVGDPVYGKKKDIFHRQALHASSLSFLYQEKSLTFSSPWPDDLITLENKIRFDLS